MTDSTQHGGGTQQYEYKVIDWDDDEWWTGESLFGGDKREWDAEEALNKYAEKGWELEQALSTNSGSTEINKLVLKRRVRA